MTLAPDEIADARAAIGRREVRRQRLDVESLRRFALAIGGDGAVERRLPVLAHWAWFLPQPVDGEIGADGHPMRGGFLPALRSLPRRMFAASTIDFAATPVLDREGELVSTIVDVVPKDGRSGTLVFVTVDRVLAQDGQERLRERQTLVYRDAGVGDAALPVEAPGFGEAWRPDAVTLFRFSAATFNAHRIHYDLPYACGEEGYPGLVVHGPLVAARLAERAAADGAVARFAYRAQAPCFAGQPIRIEAAEGGYRAIRCDGAVAASADVVRG